MICTPLCPSIVVILHKNGDSKPSTDVVNGTVDLPAGNAIDAGMTMAYSPPIDRDLPPFTRMFE
jgi:hypothetical protein